jgi:arylsulfatase A
VEVIMRLVFLLLALTLTGHTAAAEPVESARPNFVFILIDDMGWKDIGCNGSTFFETPNIDRLAAQGMRFTDAYAACPVCSPTRASILTGKYPARLHLTDWLPGRTDRPSQKLLRPKFQQFLPLEEVTLARALKPLGYVSASIGKWHLGGADYFPEKHGFDINIGGSDRGSPPSYFAPYRNRSFGIPKLEEAPKGEYLTDRLTHEAEQFIEANHHRPFFLYLAHYAVHIPLEAKQDIIAKYQAKARPGDSQNNPIYAAMVASVDASVGRLMKKLDDLRLSDRTVVFFTSDNGGLSVKEGPNTPSTSNAPLRAGKGYLYEGGIREPLIIRWPGPVKPGSTCSVPVSSVDYFPTILSLADGQADRQQVVDGKSLVPLLRQTGAFHREALFWHYPHYSNQ